MIYEPEWRGIPGFPAYEISSSEYPKIRRVGDKEPVITHIVIGSGETVSLWADGRYSNHKVDQLQYDTFPEKFIPYDPDLRKKAIGEITHILSANDVCNMIGSDFWTAEASEQIIDHLIKEGWKPHDQRN